MNATTKHYDTIIVGGGAAGCVLANRLSAASNRSVLLLEGFVDPVLSNVMNLNLNGSLHRRLTVSSSIGYSIGKVGLSENGSPFTNWIGGAGISFALARRASLDANYFVAGYRFDGDLSQAPGLAFDRQQRRGLRVAFTWRQLLIGHRRDRGFLPAD